MKPSDALAENLTAVRRLLADYRMMNPRIFGSVARGADIEGSDLDILVEPGPSASLFDLIHLEDELSTLLGVSVDVVSDRSLHRVIKEDVLAEARAL